MQVDMVFNELSLQTQARDRKKARELMSEFIKTLSTAINLGVRVLRTQNKIYSLHLTTDYPISRWLNDNLVNQDERDFFLTVETQTPLLKKEDIEIENQFSLSDVKYQGKSVPDLGIAYFLDALAISFNSEPCWDCNHIILKIEQLNENTDITEEEIEIVHASRRIHIQQQAEWIKNRIQQDISDGIELWKRRTELFPNLKFCESVRKQVQNLKFGQLEFQAVSRCLFELQKCSQNWKTESFNVDEYRLEESVDSEPTLKKYGKQRTFLCPDGVERLFSRHLKLRVCNWRIYFIPKESKNVIIGYIGIHLPTVKYPT